MTGSWNDAKRTHKEKSEIFIECFPNLPWASSSIRYGSRRSKLELRPDILVCGRVMDGQPFQVFFIYLSVWTKDEKPASVLFHIMIHSLPLLFLQ